MLQEYICICMFPLIKRGLQVVIYYMCVRMKEVKVVVVSSNWVETEADEGEILWFRTRQCMSSSSRLQGHNHVS